VFGGQNFPSGVSRWIVKKRGGKTWPLQVRVLEVRPLGYQDKLHEQEMAPSYPAAGSEA
jgi:hypothetical protein